ncbi:putative tail protein [Rhodobacter aestuarii]|uniref:Putative phage tail protein n=1 Tax=Rhodobacter aestuarii TaxID=453582 RepID=A0A1N7J6J6_9RHOB|nr:glycoside hydrolase TIM-barrel-like domain-containing protein [Rhodobacter aestuarii]PTV97133.1 putative tail protein [Rhodobacter aestuarii]SIS44887.1 Putative phage tail protein [Rhodobacter aestuarii]
MATLVLGAAGAALGAGFGGSVLGLSGAVIGRAVGATLGRVIDQRLLGAGSQAVETGRVERLRLTSASEGAPVGRLWGRMRVAGQVIWATRFAETATVQKSGKGSPRSTTTGYSYSVSLALALCEGEILRVGRIWADGSEIARDSLNLRIYTGGEDQLPDPKIAAVEGAEKAPAYRGIAYVVIEDLALGPYGNRVPQFTFEVVRAAQGSALGDVPDLTRGVQAVALIPGTGEYALATEPVYLSSGASFVDGVAHEVANQSAPGGGSDFAQSLERLGEELPACQAVSLVVSWFGSDLRCGACRLRPKVTAAERDGTNMPWRVAGETRTTAALVPRDEAGNSVYGGTPADASVLQAIAALKAAGQAVTFYPFILMDQLAGNRLPNPYTGTLGQPALPWRGRITLNVAPERDGSPDGSEDATAQVAAFFGAARAGDFAVSGGEVVYTGAEDWGLRRFVLHYAHLCALVGGVEAFCIGSELVALTRVRGEVNSFPAVEQLIALAAEVRAVLGPDCKISYAADWSEYAGYATGNGDRFFQLDALWADDNIDFIGIDNYLPLSDWRDGEEHADADWGAIYNLDYLRANIEGGELYDWYYAGEAHRAAQIRTPITDGAQEEPWIWRAKDIRSFWDKAHYERVGGVRAATPTAWVPRSKPIWFTEFGCAAVDKGTNQPNVFLDPKSSESGVPYFSDGRRDELIQMQYLRAILGYLGDAARNPVSELYGGPMVDMARAHVWAWDARPWPQFPARSDLWADGENYARGHWISGRAVSQPLAAVVGEICATAGIEAVDVAKLYGLVRGFTMGEGETGRAGLQALMLGYGVEAVERDGQLVFAMRDGKSVATLTPDHLALGESDRSVETIRAAQAEIAGRVRLAYVEADGDFEARAVEAIFPDEAGGAATGSELPLALTRAEAQGLAQRWLSEARVARDTARFALPLSLAHLGPGDVVTLDLPEGARRYRLDRVERAGALEVEAVRVEPGVYTPGDEAEEGAVLAPFAAPVPVGAVFLDLPLMRGDEDPIAPHLAVSAVPWPGTVAVYAGQEDAGYTLNTTLSARAVLGQSLSPLHRAAPGLLDRGAPLRVKLATGALENAALEGVLNGANLMAIGDGTSDNWELLQFAEAVPVAEGVWEISQRLRGQLGTDALMPEVWPEGSVVVLLDGAPEQISLAPSARGLARHYRIGSAARPYDDPSYTHRVEAFTGAGLRPLSPCHLRADAAAAGWGFTWVRRTRVDGDSWAGYEVPLGEAQELYLLRVVHDGAIKREVTLGEAAWTYPSALQVADGVAGAFAVSVAQISDSYGPGLAAQITVGG